MTQTYKPVILAISLLFALTASISAAPGDLDPTFGNGGIVITSFSNAPTYDVPVSIKVQPDGKILVCGEIRQDDADWNSFTVSLFIARYHPNGTLDASFGTNGKIVSPINSGPDFVGRGGIALQTDGKIVVVGWTSSPEEGFAVNRYNSDGTVDASFGAGGKVLTQGNLIYAAGVAVQPDGRIVVVGAAASDGLQGGVAVVRYNPDGSLDTHFGDGGKTVTHFNPYAAGLVVMLQSDGKIVVAGRNSGDGGHDEGFTLVRYQADGPLDSAFGIGGKVVQTFPNASAYLNDAVLQPDGSIVVAGSVFSPNPPEMVIVRYNPNGSVDTKFGANGVHTSTGFAGQGIALQPNGKIISFGSVYPAVSAALRLDANGFLDQGFAPNGFATTNFGNGNSYGLAGAIQPDGRILFLGYTWVGGDVVIARFVGDAVACPNPIDCADGFVRQQYRDFLGREPDTPGLAHWTSEITMCGDVANRLSGESEAQCIDRKRTNTSGAFYLSNEFQNSANFLIRVNWGSLGKDRAIGQKCIAGQHSALDAVCRPLYSDYISDLAKLTKGIVVNDALDANAINTNKHNFVNEFVMRADFLAAYPNTMTSAEYVDKLSQTTGVALTTQERADLIAKVGTDGRAAVLYDLVDGTITIDGGALVFNTRYGKAFYDQEFNPAFVFVEYLAYLRRNPDQAGFDHWLGKLNLYGNFVDAEMVRAFIISDEYRKRFGPN